MNTTVKTEHSHEILGVPGRMHNVIMWPASKRIANQAWSSENRAIAGYGTNGRITVKIRFDDNCKNGEETFSITAEVVTAESRRQRDIAAGGCLHEDITRVFPELAPLIRWHLVSTDGPMHYVENTIYHAKEHGPNRAWVYYTSPADPLGIEGVKEKCVGYVSSDVAKQAENTPGYRVKWDEKTAKTQNLDHARSSACWPEATDRDLCAHPDILKSSLLARLPGLIGSFRSDVIKCGFIWPEDANPEVKK